MTISNRTLVASVVMTLLLFALACSGGSEDTASSTTSSTTTSSTSTAAESTAAETTETESEVVYRQRHQEGSTSKTGGIAAPV